MIILMLAFSKIIPSSSLGEGGDLDDMTLWKRKRWVPWISVIWLILCGCHGMTKQNWSLLGDFCDMAGSILLFEEIRWNYTLRWTVTIICLWFWFSHILRGLCLKLGLFWPASPFSSSISSNRFGYTTESLACVFRLRESGVVELPLVHLLLYHGEQRQWDMTSHSLLLLLSASSLQNSTGIKRICFFSFFHMVFFLLVSLI